MIPMNSSTSTTDQALARISPAEAKRFLIELVNLASDTGAANCFEIRFGRLLPWNQSELHATTIKEVDFGGDPSSAVGIDLKFQQLFTLRDVLRSIWTTTDMKTKEWQIFLLQANATMTASFLSIIGP